MKAEKIKKLADSYTKAGKIVFRGKTLTLFKTINLPLIEDVAFWFAYHQNLKNLRVTGKVVPISYLKVGEIYYTSSKQVWTITQSWVDKDKMYMTARKLYPRKGEDHRMFSQNAKPNSKSSMSIKINRVSLTLIKEKVVVNNIKQLTKN